MSRDVWVEIFEPRCRSAGWGRGTVLYALTRTLLRCAESLTEWPSTIQRKIPEPAGEVRPEVQVGCSRKLEQQRGGFPSSDGGYIDVIVLASGLGMELHRLLLHDGVVVFPAAVDGRAAADRGSHECCKRPCKTLHKTRLGGISLKVLSVSRAPKPRRGLAFSSAIACRALSSIIRCETEVWETI